eukprot:5632151-Amphidinium_carterae.1
MESGLVQLSDVLEHLTELQGKTRKEKCEEIPDRERERTRVAGRGAEGKDWNRKEHAKTVETKIITSDFPTWNSVHNNYNYNYTYPNLGK